jgi:phage terminase large subunit-like protein
VALKGGKTYVSQFRTDTGWVVDKMSYEQDAREWESATLGLAMFDEPPPRDKYGATVSRMRRGGKIGIFMTPLMQSAWIMDELVGEGNKCGVVYADLEDNCRTHGVRGTLDHQHIETMIEHMDPDEVEARVHGRAMHLSNVILGKSFDRTRHMIDDDVSAPEGAQWFHVVDPARGKPWAMAWGWVDRAGNHVFDREYPEEDWVRTRETSMALKDYADLIRRVDSGHTAWRILDRHFGNSRNDYGTTLKMDLEDKFGLEFMDSYNCDNEVETGIVKVKELLRGDTLGPRLKLKRRCRNIARSLERWDRDPLTWRPKENSIYKDHFDLVRYVAMANLEPYEARPFAPRAPAYAVGR